MKSLGSSRSLSGNSASTRGHDADVIEKPLYYVGYDMSVIAKTPVYQTGMTRLSWLRETHPKKHRVFCYVVLGIVSALVLGMNNAIPQITAGQMASLRAEAYDRDAEALADNGAWLTYEQADEIGDAGLAWATKFLGLTVDTSNTERVVLRPAEVAS